MRNNPSGKPLEKRGLSAPLPEPLTRVEPSLILCGEGEKKVSPSPHPQLSIGQSVGGRKMSDKKYRVVLTDYVWDTLDVEEEALREVDAELISMQTKKTEEFIDAVRDADAILNTYAGPILKEHMKKMEKCLIIARYGIGVDTIDVPAATELGIIVTNNPTYCVDDVAEHTMALLLALTRKVVFLHGKVMRGEMPPTWSLGAAKPIFRMVGKALGLLGFGNIARRVAARAAAFGVNVLYYDPYIAAGQFKDVPGEKVELDELLSRADWVSVHTPLTKDTRHMVNSEFLSKMKPTAYLINASRGPIVDTAALVEALEGKRIAGAAVDVIEDCPPFPEDHPLKRFDNVIITPHAAWHSEEALVGLHNGAPNEVKRVLKGEWPINVVNPEVRGKNRAGLKGG